MGYIANVGRGVGTFRYHSIATANLVANAVPSNLNLNSVEIPNIVGRTILAAYARIYINNTRNSTGSNNAMVAGDIQVDNIAAGGWLTAIPTPGASLIIPANGNLAGLGYLGSIDISSKVKFNDTIDFQWTGVDVTAASMTFNGITSEIIIQTT